jgi:hypothetical protein
VELATVYQLRVTLLGLFALVATGGLLFGSMARMPSTVDYEDYHWVTI